MATDPKLSRLSWCQCSVCKEYFCSYEQFDWHRVGKGTKKRCLTQDELSDKMIQDDTGHWKMKKGVEG